MTTVGEVMSRNLLTVDPATTLAEAAAADERARRGRGARALGDHVSGILTERDVLRAVATGGVEGTHVAAWMTRDPETVDVVGADRAGRGDRDDPRRLPPPAGARRRQAGRDRLDPRPDARRRRRREPAWRLSGRCSSTARGRARSRARRSRPTRPRPARRSARCRRATRDDAQLAIGAANRAADALGAADGVRARGGAAPRRRRGREAARGARAAR